MEDLVDQAPRAAYKADGKNNEYDEYYEHYDKGYVIRCVNQYDGRVFYRGQKGRYVTEKDVLMPNETYTISGVKRAKANLE